MATDEDDLQSIIGDSDFTDDPQATDAHHPAAPYPTRNANRPIILPKWIFIKDREGRYLINRPEVDNYTLTFGPSRPIVPNCTFQTSQTSSDSYRIRTRNWRSIMRYHKEWYSADGPTEPSFKVESGMRRNRVYLKDDYSPSLYFSNDLNQYGAPLALSRARVNGPALMEIVEASINNRIADVVYDIPGATVKDAEPIVALETSVRNYSDVAINQSLTYTYQRWSVGTWNNVAGVEIGSNANFSAGVPFISSPKSEVSILNADSSTHEWGEEDGKRETVTSSTTVTVPPKKKARATIIIRNAQIDVGFTYTQRIEWEDGTVEDLKKDGVYSNVVSWHVDVHLDNLESV